MDATRVGTTVRPSSFAGRATPRDKRHLARNLAAALRVAEEEKTRTTDLLVPGEIGYCPASP